MVLGEISRGRIEGSTTGSQQNFKKAYYKRGNDYITFLTRLGWPGNLRCSITGTKLIYSFNEGRETIAQKGPYSFGPCPIVGRLANIAIRQVNSTTGLFFLLSSTIPLFLSKWYRFDSYYAHTPPQNVGVGLYQCPSTKQTLR